MQTFVFVGSVSSTDFPFLREQIFPEDSVLEGDRNIALLLFSGNAQREDLMYITDVVIHFKQ